MITIILTILIIIKKIIIFINIVIAVAFVIIIKNFQYCYSIIKLLLQLWNYYYITN